VVIKYLDPLLPPPKRRRFGMVRVHPHLEFYTTSKGTPHSSLPSQRRKEKELLTPIFILILYTTTKSKLSSPFRGGLRRGL
jgi:hypothetical protein